MIPALQPDTWATLLAKRERHWFLSPWPYLGGALAFAMFVPVILWNAEHGWISFLLQFGRVGNGGLTLRFLGEFLGTQLGLATPLVAVLATAGFILILRSREVTASTVRRPFLTFVMTSPADAIIASTWPPRRSVSAGPPPL